MSTCREAFAHRQSSVISLISSFVIRHSSSPPPFGIVTAKITVAANYRVHRVFTLLLETTLSPPRVMKTLLILTTAAALFSLASCETDGTTRSTNTGRGAVSGPASGWTTGTGGMGNVTRDSGSSLRGAGVGAGTSGSTGTGWTYGTTASGAR
jgi:hypothetical protein